jgi:hypothetical protein
VKAEEVERKREGTKEEEERGLREYKGRERVGASVKKGERILRIVKDRSQKGNTSQFRGSTSID